MRFVNQPHSLSLEAVYTTTHFAEAATILQWLGFSYTLHKFEFVFSHHEKLLNEDGF